MRLIVYGGNSFNERRRIGTWSQNIASEGLQDRARLLERRPAFGIGIHDETPFLIFRRLQSYSGRSYPFTVLLDPGEEYWDRFEWNAARLLQALFEPGGPGEKILNSPESINSDLDLRQLFEQLPEEAPKINPELSSITDKTAFLECWTAAAASELPVILGADESFVSIRPTLSEMSYILSEIPLPLRCATGWMLGANKEQAAIFGAHFALDDQMEEIFSKASEERFRELQSEGKKYLENLERINRYAFNSNGDFSEIKTFLKEPFFNWQKAQGILLKKVFTDFNLMSRLLELSDRNNALSFDSDNLEEQTMLELVPRLNNSNGTFSRELELLTHRYLGALPLNLLSNDRYLKLVLLSRFNVRKAKENQGFNQQDSRQLDLVLFELLKCSVLATPPTDVPRTLLSELHDQFSNSKPEIKTEEWKNFAEELFYKTKISNEAMLNWKAVLEQLQIRHFADLEQHLKREIEDYAVSFEVLNNSELWHLYLVFGNDAGGQKLVYKHNLKNIEYIAIFALEESKGNKVWKREALQWLINLLQTEAFRFVSLQTKKDILDELKKQNVQSWKNYELFLKIFTNQSAKLPSPKLNEIEEINLTSELKERLELVKSESSSTNNGFSLQLENLTAVFSPKYYPQITNELYSFSPCFKNTDVLFIEKWLNGWTKIWEKSSDKNVKEKALSKLIRESARLLVDLNMPVISNFLEKGKIPLDRLCQEDAGIGEFAKLSKELLCGGNQQQDIARIKRFNEICPLFSFDIRREVLIKFFDLFFSNSTFELVQNSSHKVPEDISIYDGFKKYLACTDGIEFENFYRRFELDQEIDNSFKQTLKERPPELITGLKFYRNIRVIECLERIKKLFNKPLKEVKDSVKSLESEYGEFFRKAVDEFYKVLQQAPSIELYNNIIFALDEYLTPEQKNELLRKKIRRILFEENKVRNDLIKEFKEENGNSINTAISTIISEYLEQSENGDAEKSRRKIQTEGKIFFERYLKNPEIAISREFESENYDDIAGKIFETLKPETQQRLLAALCENDSIEKEFSKSLSTEYLKCQRKAIRDNPKPNKREKKHALSRDFDVEMESSKNAIPNFSPYQKAVLKLFGNITEESEECLVNLKNYVAKARHKGNRVSLHHQLKKWGIPLEKKNEEDIEEEQPNSNLINKIVAPVRNFPGTLNRLIKSFFLRWRARRKRRPIQRQLIINSVLLIFASLLAGAAFYFGWYYLVEPPTYSKPPATASQTAEIISPDDANSQTTPDPQVNAANGLKIKITVDQQIDVSQKGDNAVLKPEILKQGSREFTARHSFTLNCAKSYVDKMKFTINDDDVEFDTEKISEANPFIVDKKTFRAEMKVIQGGQMVTLNVTPKNNG